MVSKFIGDYSYSDNIKSPSELGMSPNADKLEDNVNGLMDYTKLLSTGGGAASRTGEPLGNRYFLKTISKCNKDGGDVKADRYLYIDNIPSGDKHMRGLIPGIAEGIASLNPLKLITALGESGTQPCVDVQLKVTGGDIETKPITCSDLDDISPSAIYDATKFTSLKTKCKNLGNESFRSKIRSSYNLGFILANKNMRSGYKFKVPRLLGTITDPLTNLYITLIGGMLIYIIYNLTKG
jgi:hypothetical protein